MVYKSIDILKMVMALLVVTIHCYVAESVDNALGCRLFSAVLGTAVPFFYVTSAFLLFRHAKTDGRGRLIDDTDFKARRKKYLKHILTLFVVWYALYLTVKPDLLAQGAWAVVHDLLFCGGWHLWYLWGLLWVIPLMNRLLTKVNGGGNILLGFGLMCLFRLYSHYGSVSEPTWWQEPLVWSWTNNPFNVRGFTCAWACIAVGAWMAMDDRWRRISRKWYFLILAGSLALAAADPSTGVSVCYQPAAFAIVALCLRWNIKKESSAFRWCRDLSTYTYLVHMFIVSLAGYVADGPWGVLAVSIPGSVVAGWLIVVLKRKTGLRWI